MRPSLLIAALAAASALGGCSGDGPRVGDTEKVQTTVETILRLCGDENGPGVEDLLAEDTRRRFIEAGGVLEGCNAVLRLAAPGEVPSTSLFVEARVADVRRTGDHAFATVEARGRSTRVRLEDTGLRWYVENPPLYEPAGVDPRS